MASDKSGKRPIDALRDEVRARSRAAGKKASRLRGKWRAEGFGASVGKVDALDPRRTVRKSIDRMNSRELKSYLGRLNNYVSRETQYVPGAGGTPLSGKLVRQYRVAENKANIKDRKRLKSIENVFIEPENRTVSERVHQRMERRKSRNYDPVVNTTYGDRNKSMRGVVSEKALKVLIKALEKQTTPKYDKDELRKARRTLSGWLKQSNDYDLIKRINKLDSGKFWLLWSQTDFTDAQYLRYFSLKNYSPEEQAKQDTGIASNQRERIERYLTWTGV